MYAIRSYYVKHPMERLSQRDSVTDFPIVRDQTTKGYCLPVITSYSIHYTKLYDTERQKTLDKTSITIYDVARMADVSTSTVSRVLNGNVKVSEEKAERVRKIVDQYHFTLNPLAQNFYKQKTKNIGVIVPDIRNAFYSTLYVECEKEAQALGYRIV